MNWGNLFGGGRTRIRQVDTPAAQTGDATYQERFQAGIAGAEESLKRGDYPRAGKTLRTLRDLTREAPLGVSGQYAAALKTLEERTEAEGGNAKYIAMMGKATIARGRGDWDSALGFLREADTGAFYGKRTEGEKEEVQKLINDTEIRIKLEDLLKGIRGERYGYPTKDLDEIESTAKEWGVDASEEISQAREPVLRGALVIARRQLDELKAGKYPEHDLTKTVWEVLNNLQNARDYAGKIPGFQMPAAHAELRREAHGLGMEYYARDAREHWAKGDAKGARTWLGRARSFAENAGVSLPADLDLITAAAPAGEESS